MKEYVFGWQCKINHMKTFNSLKKSYQEVILCNILDLMYTIRDNILDISTRFVKDLQRMFQTRYNIRDNLWTFMGSCIYSTHIRTHNCDPFAQA